MSTLKEMRFSPHYDVIKIITVPTSESVINVVWELLPPES